MELFIYYIIPNVIMFGGLYALAKFLELICDHETIVGKN